MGSSTKTFRKEELNNNVLKEIYKRNFPNFKIYERNEDGQNVIIVQKNGSVAVSARVFEIENSKIVEFEWCDTDSFFHMRILPWILILLAVFPAVIWFVVHLMGRSSLQENCSKVLQKYFEDASILRDGNILVE